MTKITASNYIGREQNSFNTLDQIYGQAYNAFERTAKPYPVFNSKREPVKEYRGEVELKFQLYDHEREQWQDGGQSPECTFEKFSSWFRTTRRVFIITEPEKSDKEPAYYGRVNTSKMFTPKDTIKPGEAVGEKTDTVLALPNETIAWDGKWLDISNSEETISLDKSEAIQLRTFLNQLPL